MVASYKARAWNEETDGSGEFAIPDVPDGTYKAQIVEVEDREFPGYQGGPPQQKYMVDWAIAELIGENDKPVQLRQFVTIPAGLINDGYLHPKAQLYKFLAALGFNPDAESFEVDPFQWSGKEAMIWVKNIASKKQPDEVRPQITDVTKLQAAGARRATTRRVESPEDDF